MAVSNIKTVLSADISKVWDVVTDVENYSWRSDLSRTELLEKNQFVEYTKKGYPTTLPSLLQCHMNDGSLIWRTVI